MLHCLRQEYVEDGLDLTIVVEKVVVFDLCDLIDTCLLTDVRRCWRLWQELISLDALIVVFRCGFALLSEEIGQVYLNSCGRTRTQVVGGDLVLGLFKLLELGLDHFKFALLSFRLEPQILPLSRSQRCILL